MARIPFDVVRPFLRACAEGRRPAGRIPAALKDCATAALRGAPASSVVSDEDVVAELLLRLWSGLWTGLAWAAVDDTTLERRLRKALRDIVVEQTEGWSYRKALREHVAAAIRAGLPAPGGDLPATICDGTHFSRPLVALAAAWVVEADPETEGDASRVTRTLCRLYAPSMRSLGAANDDAEDVAQTEPFDALARLEAADDAARVARGIEALLTPAEREILLGRLDGRGLQELADGMGCAVSTVFKREKRAVEKAGAVVRRRRVGPQALARALTMLAG